MAFKNIVSNKLRSALTMLGLIIGIASVIILVGIGQGATSSVTDSVKSLGTDILTLNISSNDTYIEYDKIKDFLNIDNISSVAPYKSISSNASRITSAKGCWYPCSPAAIQTAFPSFYLPCGLCPLPVHICRIRIQNGLTASVFPFSASRSRTASDTRPRPASR